MSQWLRAIAALTENENSVHSIHVRQSTNKLGSMTSDPLTWPPWALIHTQMRHTQKYKQKSLIKKKKLWPSFYTTSQNITDSNLFVD